MKVDQMVGVAANGAATGGTARDGALPGKPDAETFLSKVRQLPGVQSINALPNSAVNGASKSVSWVAKLQGWVIPALAANVVNCGIGLMNTGLMEDEVDDTDLKAFLQKVWRVSYSEDYTVSRDMVDGMFLQGVGALTRKEWLTKQAQEAFEFGGTTSVNCLSIDLDRYIPPLLRMLPTARRPSRLNLMGSHFVDIKVVDQVDDPDGLSQFGLKKGQLVLLLHTDHRITQGINLHYASHHAYFRMPFWKRSAYFLSKAWFHFGNQYGWASFKDRWQHYFRDHEYAGIPLDSNEGRRYITAYKLNTNYGYAGRAVIYRMLADVLQDLFGQQVCPRLVCDTNHESIRVSDEENGDKATVTIRRGAVQCVPNKPGTVAGNPNTASLLGAGTGSESTDCSYAHGPANFQQSTNSTSGSMTSAAYTAKRHLVSLDGNRPISLGEEQFSVYSPASMEVLARVFQYKGIMRPVAWLRPVASLAQR